MSLSTDSRARVEATAAMPGSPGAIRHRRTAWKDPRLFVGLALVAASALLGATLLGGGDEVGVWAARTALAEGQPVTTADLVRREVGFAAQADADLYLPADRELPEGATVSHDVGAGELLAKDAVRLGAEDPLVEVPLAVAPTAVPATVAVGSVVDVWVVPDAAAGTAASAPAPAGEALLVLDDVTVLHLSGGAGPLGAAAERQVIVGLGRDQQQAIPAALAGMTSGSVVLTTTR